MLNYFRLFRLNIGKAFFFIKSRGIKPLLEKAQSKVAAIATGILEGSTYEMIWAIGTVHHISRLESLCEQINCAFKDHGILIMREYIEPNYLQFALSQLAMTDTILSILPGAYKNGHDGLAKNKKESLDIEPLRLIVPPQSVRSKDMLNAMKQRLQISEAAHTSGIMLQPLLSAIGSNFETDEDAETVLKLLIFWKRLLTENWYTSNDYVFCMAKKGFQETNEQILSMG
jgi:hypothetical protein